MKMQKFGHLGGYISADEENPHGDSATWCPAAWGYLADRFNVREVVDVGCGEGHALEWFLDHGFNAWGIDGVAEAKQAFEKRRPEHASRFVVHDYTKKHYPISLDTDLIWCCEFVEHVSQAFMMNFLHTFTHSKVVAMTHAFPNQSGHHHVNCVVEGTQVAASSIQAAFRRRYSGEIVTLVTAGGNELTVTPNHPVMTRRGWVPAGLLQQGDDLVCGSSTERMRGRVTPDADQRPASAEEVFRATQERFPLSAARMPISAEDFHGDGAVGDVDVVRADRFLRDARLASLLHRCDEGDLVGRLPVQRLFERLRSFGLGGLCVSLASSLFVEPVHPPLLFDFVKAVPSLFVDLCCSPDGHFEPSQRSIDDAGGYAKMLADCDRVFPGSVLQGDRRFVEWHPFGFADVPNLDASFGQDTLGRPVIGAEFGRQFAERLPVEVAFAQLLEIRSHDFAGHVYNYSTPEQAYLANGIVVHNCQNPDYWMKLMDEINFGLDSVATDASRKLAPGTHWQRSGLVFVRRHAT